MTSAEVAHPAQRVDQAWPALTRALLALTGVALAAFTFVTVMAMPDLPYHPARDAELRATYDVYRETGVPLVKENGTGSWYGTVEGTGLTKAAGDDDPGSYLIASWMSHLTGSDSPYPGLEWAMALLCALPWLFLPMTVARIFGRPRAGFALLALPVFTWLVNGTFLVGSQYGLFDLIAPVKVYALYGLPSAVVFLSLALAAYALARRMGWRGLLAISVVLVLLGTSSNLMRSMSGVGIAAAVGVLWWISAHRWRGRLLAVGAGLAAVLLVQWLPSVVMDRIDASRDSVISADLSHLPDAHGTWHPLYLGLSYPQPINGEESSFGVVWSDEWGWAKAREVDPAVVPASVEYDEIIRTFYLDAVRERPWAALLHYADKTAYTARHFAGALVLVAFAAVLMWRRRVAGGRLALGVFALTVPTLVLGLVPPVMVMPMLYYFSELVAGIGLLTAVALGGAVCALSKPPAPVSPAVSNGGGGEG